MSNRLQINVQGGNSDRTTIELVPGTPVEPFSVGAAGSWVISGPGVAPTHAYLYFDGTTLFVACAPGAVVRSGAKVFTTDWDAVRAPSEIQLGGVRLVVNAPHPEAARAAPTKAPMNAPVPAPQPAEQSYDIDDAPTQYQPIPPGFTDPNAPREPTPRPRPERIEPAPQSDRTRVMPPRDEPQPAQAAQPAEAARPERPAPPSVPPPTSDGATVVQPLEEYLQKGVLRPGEDPDTRKRPIGAPLPAAGAPPPGRTGAMGVYIKPGEATGPGTAHSQQGSGQQQPPWGAAPGYAQQGASVPQGPQAFSQLQDPAGYPQMQGQPGYPQAQAQPGYPPGYGPQSQAGYGQQTQAGYAQQAGYGQPGYAQPGQPGYGQMPGQPGFGQMQGGASMPPGVAMGPPYPGAPGAPAAKKGPLDELTQAWKTAPLPRKITYLIAPFAIIGFFIIFFANDPAPQPRTHKGAKSAKVVPSGSAPVNVPPKPDAGSVPPVRDVIVPQLDASAARPDAAAVAKTEDHVAVAPTQSASADAGPPKLPPGEKLTKERKAVDAVAAGDYAKAIQLYEELAKENPQNPVFRTAAEMLKRKRGK